jgi:uncharacterized protein (DUF885 family)
MITSNMTLRAACIAIALAFAPSAYAEAPAAPAQAAQASARQQLDTLADRYYTALARFDPIGSTQAGSARHDDEIGMGIVPEVRAQHYAAYRKFQSELRAIDRAALGPKDQVNYDILEDELKHLVAFEQFPTHLLPITQMGSTPVTLANFAGGQGAQPFATVKDYRAYLNRLSQLPMWIHHALINMREGMRTGVVLPRPLAVSALPQYKKLVSASAHESIYYTPVKNIPAAFSAQDKAALAKEYETVIGDKLMPALARLATFLEAEYLPATRTSTGIDALPNGRAWYLANVAEQTTTTLTPEQIHATGLKEVARIQGEFAKVGPRMGYTGPAAGLPGWVSQQAKFKPFKHEDEIIAEYRRLDGVLRTKLPALFTLMPKAPLDLRLEPELSRATASDHYTAPAADGSRPGVFWSVVNDPAKYDSTQMVTLFLHEGQPGHHFHIALLQELDLPDFRKFGGNNAYTEGWALYAETLGKEMDLFGKPEHYFGHLNDEMLRAVRLVVDTGMHAKGWTREQSIKYMQDTLGYPERLARSETERYMAWPGQALGYKVGSLKIAELRARATKALGAKFSLPKFHEVVLSDGTVPLSLLEAKVDRWIASSK